MDLKTVFIITVTTSRMIFPGISPTSRAGSSEPVRIPAAKSITFQLHGSTHADGQSKAEVSVPEALKTENPLRLDISLQAAEPVVRQPDESKFVLKSYWGCGETVPEGQPKVVTSTDPGPATIAPAAGPATNLPYASYAHWPTRDSKPLESDASTQGTYALTTSYAGNASVTLGKEQDFLPTVDLVGTPKKANLEKPVKIMWKTVPGAVAFLVTANGGNGRETISWTSSSDPHAAGLEERTVERTELDKLVEKKVLLPSYATTCTIPAGIFKGSKTAFVTITAFGADKIERNGAVETQVMVRSIVSIPIYGTSYKPQPDEGDKDAPPPPPPMAPPTQ